MKCFDCICGIRNRNRIWCAKYKRIPTREMAEKCKHFAARENTLRPFLKTKRRDYEGNG
jgi:hypothetical protein